VACHSGSRQLVEEPSLPLLFQAAGSPGGLLPSPEGLADPQHFLPHGRQQLHITKASGFYLVFAYIQFRPQAALHWTGMRF